MKVKDLILKNRSYRRFHQYDTVTTETLTELVDLARIGPSGANLQPLKYVLTNDPVTNAKVFKCLKWAGYLADWDGPEEGERPAAYITVLGDTTIKQVFKCDHGIAAQNILLGAVELGLGGCIIASIDDADIHHILDIPHKYDVLLVIAIGRPAEEVVLDDISDDGDVKYWRDSNSVHHVPKRKLKDIIL